MSPIAPPDNNRKNRIAEIEHNHGPAIRQEAESLAGRGREALKANAGSVLSAAAAEKICDRFDIEDIEFLMALLVDTAALRARPPISGFFVGAVGLEAETGNLILGGNLEFPGTHLGFSVHGEGFVSSRAFSRGTSVKTIALSGAHPCGHCRQYLSEFAIGADLNLVDPLGHRLKLADLYPWPFSPEALDEKGAEGGRINFPDLALADSISDAIAPALLAAGKRAHAPYSRSPGAVVLELKGGALISGATIESVAFNPTMPPLQAALIDLLAHGFDYNDIERATLGTVTGGPVDYARSTAELLTILAPQASLDVHNWSGL
ncbi:cytidine deaminase [Martelella alba]|uniref:cytidine deaminase n=1 Tax=Martelella alba TaxID=2590451 RepID=UPI0015E85D0B|nr:cytidine deaminase [Martelella alba]